MSPELNEAQKNAVTAGDTAPLLIVAGAGTGKTRTLTERIRHLIAQGTPPERIYAVTFTNKAAREMASRVLGHGGGGRGKSTDGRQPFMGTFHSLGVRLLREDAALLGRTANFVIYDDHDTMQLLRRLVKHNAAAKELKRGAAFFREAISKIKSAVDGAAAMRELNEEYPKKEAELVRDVYAAYETAVRESNAFDFDDLIEKPVRLMREHPEVLAKHRARVGFLFVDEFQDVNPIQHELIRLLVGPGAHLSVVGDDQQTIYSWRGSSVETFLEFEQTWPGARVIMLEENYRSVRLILDAANAVIANNTRQKPKRLFTQRDGGDPITVFEALNEDTEAMWIAESVKRLLEEKSAAKNGGEAADAKPSVGILYRTNAQSRAVEQALIMYGVPYVMFGGVQFYERREIKDIVAALRLAVNPADTVSAERLRKTLKKAEFTGVLEATVRFAQAKGSERSPLAFIQEFLKTAHYIEYLEREFVNAPERMENVNELMRFATEFTEIAPFLEQVSLMQSTDRGSSGTTSRGRKRMGDNAVSLMTMHMAKGLEFDHVFIAGAQEGILPHQRSLDTLDELEEERRLMYVAMTRARKTLSASFSDIPSRFLFEIPEDYVRFRSERTTDDVLVDDEERYITID